MSEKKKTRSKKKQTVPSTAKNAKGSIEEG